MINLELAEQLRTLLALLISYFPTTIAAGYGQAWVAKKCGDDTPQELGFLSFNPAVHFDIVGFIVLIFFGYGWGKMVPINPFSIHAPRRMLKLGIIFLSPMVIHFILAVVALFFLVLMGGFVFTSPTALAMPLGSSLFISLKFIVTRFMILNIILAALFFALGLARFLIVQFASDADFYSRTSDVVFLILTILFIWLVISYVQQFMFFLVILIEWLINAIFGVLR